MRRIAPVIAAVLWTLSPAHAQNATSWVSRTIAGSFPIGDGGQATAALLESPQAVAADTAGNLYIADGGNGAIRKVSRTGIITSIATYSGYTYDLKLDAAGNLFVAGGNRAYKITPDGVVSVVAGNGTFSNSTGDGGPATSAGFNGIYALAVDANNNIFICDSNNHRIRKVTPDGIVRTIAGGGNKGFAGDNGPAANSLLNYPRHAAVDSSGNLYVNDYNNNRVRKITPAGIISTVAGSNLCCDSPNGGLATGAYLYTGPVTTDPSGNIYIWDLFTGKVRRVTPAGIINDYAGSGQEGFAGDGGVASNARFSSVTGLGTDAQNNLYIVDGNNERIRKVSPDSSIGTVAGRSHFSGDGATATAAILHRPTGVVTASDGTVYFTDTVNHRVRKIGPDGTINTLAGTGEPGFAGDNGPAAAAQLYFPDSITIDTAGNLYVVDQYQRRIRKITPAGTISTVAGNGNLALSNDARGALGSGFAYITGIAIDTAGNLYVSESFANKIKKIVPTGGMTTYAGTGGEGFGGDGLSATQAVLDTPGALAVDGSVLYIADTYNYRIRKIDPGTGAITTVAGTGVCCDSGDGGKATLARVDAYGLLPDGNGGLWFTDSTGVRFIAKDGTITRTAGGQALGFAGDDSPAGSNTMYNSPAGITLSRGGDIIVADTYNSRIRKLQPNDPARMDIVSGNNQTGTTGAAMQAFVIKVTGKAGIGALGVPVTFAVTSGSADLSARTTNTDLSGQAGVSAIPTKAGTLTITATAGAFTATFSATIKDAVVIPPATDVPVISQGGIGQNGFSVPPVQTISAGAITTIYGSNFLAAGSAPAINQVADGQLSTNFAGVCVTVGGVRAPIFAVAATQVTIEVPEVPAGSAPVQVIRNCGTAAEQKSNILTASAQSASPELLYLQTNADGRNPVAAVGLAGEWIGAPGSIAGATLRPAKPGDILVVYALGFGSTIPAQVTGVPAAGAAQVAQSVGITIGGVPLAPADIQYAGASPYFIGLYQINLRVPDGVPSRNQSIIVKIGSSQSPAGGYLAVQ